MTALDFVKNLTNFGDLAVLLPVAVAIFVWLAYSRTWQTAAAWAFAFSICIAGTGFLKVLFVVCPPAVDLRSPSGHTSLSTLVYGGLAMLLATRVEGWQRIAAIGAGCVLTAAIAVSRVVLNSHTVLETATGIVIGGLALAFFGRAYLSPSSREASLRPLLLSVAILVVLLHGHQLHAEDLVRAIGGYLRTDGLSCR